MITLALTLLHAAPAQDAAPGSAGDAPAPVEETIRSSFEARERINQRGMLLLGGWSTAHLLWSSAALLADAEAQGFHQMNLAWSGVNLAIAGGAILSSRNASQPRTLASEITAQHRIEKILLTNAGLDAGYVGVGALLFALGSERDDSRLEGFGTAVMLQGGFLLIFDLILAHLQSRNRRYEAALPR